MYVLSCFPSFGHRRSGANVVAQRDPVGLWMVNHRLPSNFYNEVDGDCIKILGGVISICGKCGKTTRAEWRKRECNPIHYSSLRSRHQVPRGPQNQNPSVSQPVYTRHLSFRHSFGLVPDGTICMETTFGGGKKNYRECCIPGLGCWHTE